MLARLLAIFGFRRARRRGSSSSVRRSERNTMFRTGSIIVDTGAHRSVAVKSLSDTGARIEFHTREPLPEEFTLVEPIGRIRRRARVVWQDEYVAGLEFVDG